MFASLMVRLGKIKTKLASTAMGRRACGVAAFAALLVPGYALAGVGLSVTPTFPNAVTPGNASLNASLSIGWFNQGANYNAPDVVTAVTLTPSCGVAGGNTCPAALQENYPITLSG